MYKLFLLVFCCSSLIGANADDYHYIESPQVTEFGTWGVWDVCPENQFVIGMQLKVERSDGWKDDSALNGIRFFCSNLGEGVSGVVTSGTRSITSTVGPFGKWKSVKLCGESGSSETSGVVGFQLRSEKNKGAFDDTAANNLRILCSDLGAHHLNDRVVEGDGSPWGDWTSLQQCQRGYAICGLLTQVEGNQGGNGDDTALNNLKAKCCKVKLVEKEVVAEDRPSVNFPNPADFAKLFIESIQQRAEEKATVTERISTAPSSTSTEASTISIVTSTEPTEPSVAISSSSTELPTVQLPSLTSAEKDEEARYREKVLSEELKKLSKLEFGASESTYTVDIPSDESVSVDDIQEANPIVPPHVIHTASAVHATDADNEDNKDPDPSKVEYISGTIITQTSTAPAISSEEEEEESTPATPAIHKKLESSNSAQRLSSFRTLSLTLLYFIVWVLSI